MTRYFRALASVLALPLLIATAPAAPNASAPATVSKEGDLTTVVLKPEAEQRLRLKTVPVERRVVAVMRLFAGEVVRPLGGAGRPVAPVLGGSLEEVLRVADQQAVADGRVATAQLHVDAAAIALERARKILEAEAGSMRNRDEAKSTLDLAQAALTTARDQRALLGAAVGEAEASRRSWVRVAIYSGEVARLDAQAGATVRALASSGPGLSAAPVSGPPTANAAAASVDWYYELPAGLNLRAGERVAVEISTVASRVESLVVPCNAVLYDIHGGQWVYAVMAPHTYARQRVQVGSLVGEVAVLASGPAVGTAVVTDGAAELFGTEFMTGK